MLNFLNKPYPFNEDLKHNAKIVFFICIGILAFLLLFQPIDITELSTKKLIQLVIGLGLSTFVVLSINLIVLPSLIPKIFYYNNWNIKKEILWNLWIMLSITGSDLLFYTKLLGVIDISFSIIAKVMLLGFVPVSVLIIINQERLNKSHLKSANELNKRLLENKGKKEKLIHFESDYKNDNLSILPNSLLFIKSADNYIEIFYRNENTVKKQMIRSSLKKAEDAVNEFDFIFRCHRAYIVNINQIKEIQGNSQGYKLYFDEVESPALVSQQYISSFKKKI